MNSVKASPASLATTSFCWCRDVSNKGSAKDWPETHGLSEVILALRVLDLVLRRTVEHSDGLRDVG